MPYDPFNPKVVLLQWTQPNLNAIAGTNYVYFGGFSGWGGGFPVTNDTRAGRFRLPFACHVKKWEVYAQFVPYNHGVACDWNLLNESAGTTISTVSMPGLGTQYVETAVSALLNAGTILNCTQVDAGGGGAGGYNVICTATCEVIIT